MPAPGWPSLRRSGARAGAEGSVDPTLGRLREPAVALICRLGAGEPEQRERAEQEPDVAQDDVAVAADEQEADDDATQPARDQQTAETGADQGDKPGQDLNRPDDVHRVLGAAG